jgi:hypothetical protein
MGGSSHDVKLWETELTMAQNRAVTAGEMVIARSQMNFPANLPSSTRRRWWTSPRHFWRFDLKTRCDGRLAYNMQWFIRVQECSADAEPPDPLRATQAAE